LEDGRSSKEKGMEGYGGGDGAEGVIQHDATFRSYTNNMRRLSRSLDGLYLVCSYVLTVMSLLLKSSIYEQAAFSYYGNIEKWPVGKPMIVLMSVYQSIFY
jgi:hypothetical protein